MAFLQSNIPYFKAWVRREYTTNHDRYHGEFLHAMVIGREYSDDTVFTSPPPLISSFLCMLFAPFARLLGYKATEQRYLEDSFWEKHVNQPPK